MKRVVVALIAVLATAGWMYAVSAAADAPDGKKLFDANCAKCHGVDGKADTPVGKALHAHVLAEAQFASLDGPKLIHIIRENPKHKAVTGKVTDAQLTAIAGHIRELAAGASAPK